MPMVYPARGDRWDGLLTKIGGDGITGEGLEALLSLECVGETPCELPDIGVTVKPFAGVGQILPPSDSVYERK